MDKKSENIIKTEFLIHDLKVPIAVIDAGAKALLEKRERYGPLTEKQEKVLKRIIRSTVTSQRLVNDALELGRSREGVRVVREVKLSTLVLNILTDIFDLLDPAVSEQISVSDEYEHVGRALRESGTRLAFQIQTWQEIVSVDDRKVSQILRNLLTNAYKYRSRIVTIHGDIDNGFLIFKVEDDGCGIPEKDRAHIFTSYYTTGSALESKVEGHGLGLAGVVILLEDLGGDISLNCGKDCGTVFTVKIPLEKEKN